MRTDLIQTIHRQDYAPYPYRLTHVRLEFDLDADRTQVHSHLHFEALDDERPALVLNGEDLELLALSVEGRPLADGDYFLDETRLQLTPPHDRSTFTVQVTSACRPAMNTQLMGLYVSGDKLFTQCEAEGFRRITWFPDRPDVMARFEVVLRGDPNRYPLMLSNGNLVAETTLPDGRREVHWQDPHPKPSYLFALVAGDFDCLERNVATRSGRPVLLQVYSDRGCRDQTHWALDCLERALRWDETRFGLELDLDRFMIVAARDFNMGAMENKGLNIFNATYVLADPQTATDATYRRIEAVIGHEYFHNWTGNRVTCRDWFQISLKEGLTVFREQEFSADMLAEGLPEQEAASARAVKRIDDVRTLRMAQFPEDAGPMAHPIRPESYQEIANFYTPTVYEKGAEVIRMQHTLLGEQGFRAGIDEYFRRHDGQAVTCDDFVAAMESVYMQDHPGNDFQRFRRWYAQAGTPRVRVEIHHDAARHQCRLTLSQHCDPVGLETRQAAETKPPLHIPFAIGFVDQHGAPCPVTLDGTASDTRVLELKDARQSWVFDNLPEPVIPSLLRGFSAPVIVECERSLQDLALLACHDNDPFARWDAAQELALRCLTRHMAQPAQGQAAPLSEATLLQDVWLKALQDPALSPAYRARLLTLPSIRELLEHNPPLDPIAAVRAHQAVRQTLSSQLVDEWRALYERMDDGEQPYSPDAVSAGRRALRNLALDALLAAGAPDAIERAQHQYRQAGNMTARFGALAALLRHTPPAAAELVADFHDRWKDNPNVIDSWFAVQAGAPASTVTDLHTLMSLPDFSLRNPNRARSVIFRFCTDNPGQLHTPEGYDFWAEQVLALDQLNPEVAARLARLFDNWARHEPVSREAMKAALQRVREAAGLSRNVHEVVARALDA